MMRFESQNQKIIVLSLTILLFINSLVSNVNLTSYADNEKSGSVGSMQDSQITFDADTSIEYELSYAGIKENIIDEQYTGQTEYSYIINSNGLKLIEDENALVLVDKIGDTKSYIGRYNNIYSR